MGTPFDAAALVAACVAAGVDVVGIADHDAWTSLPTVMDAFAASSVVAVPGVEVTTDRGHVLVLAPCVDGSSVIAALCARVGVRAGSQVPFHALLEVVRDESPPDGDRFCDTVVLIGAHVDTTGSLLGPQQSIALEAQIAAASRLAALEVADPSTRDQWIASGVKQQSVHTIVQSSDAHDARAVGARTTFIYLPTIDTASLRHALATPEASLRFDAAPERPTCSVDSVEFVGGFFDGLTFEFLERCNAVIGPPSSGKSLVIDALRFAFGLECPIQEIARLAASRLHQCLPTGAEVRVKGTFEGEVFEVARAMGAGSLPAPPFKPIIFSQNELARRAMDPRPAMALLDVHCPDTPALESRWKALGDAVEAEFLALLELAAEARDLAEVVENAVDGLAATRASLEELTGSEPAARLAMDTTRTASWRRAARDVLTRWAGDVGVSAPPELPPIPPLETDRIPGNMFLRSDVVDAAHARFMAEVEAAATRARDSLLDQLTSGDAAFAAIEAQTADDLAEAGFKEGSEVLEQLGRLRARLGDLEAGADRLRTLQAQIDAGIGAMRQRIAEADDTDAELRNARKEACRRVNTSMSTFFAKLDVASRTETLDRLLDDAKVGTNLWPTSLAEVRENLDRVRLLEYAIRRRQGRPDLLTPAPELVNQDRVVDAALERDKGRALARLAVAHPEDDLHLALREPPKTAFDGLTEGMRALAIKEISFAASALPVITDQPEDAVPTQAVYDRLVPTLRKQRAQRQFIVASHDANIVVSGDMERIVVLDPDGSPQVGSLFDQGTMAAALELLEGGRPAFERRGRRYGALP